MRKRLCFLGIGPLILCAAGVFADETPVPRPATEPPAATAVPAARPAPPSTPPAAAKAAPAPGSAHATPSASPSAPSADKAQATPPTEPDVLMLRLKAQIKSVRLSLAEATGRLAVTDKDLSSASADNGRLRAENTSLQTNLAKAETASKKAEDEVAARRREMQVLEQRVSGSGPSGSLAVALVLALLVSSVLAVAVFGHGKQLRSIAERLPDGDSEKRRLAQLRTQLEEEQQRAVRLEDECKRLRETSNKPVPVAAAQPGSKRDKLEGLRRELSEARTTADEQRRVAADRIQALEAEVQKLAGQNQKLEQALGKANEKLIFLGHDEPEETTTVTANQPPADEEPPPSLSPGPS